jgi:hypothetical protein
MITIQLTSISQFMAVAGISAYLSLRKRRGNLLRLLGERATKLLLGFAFGMIIVAIPSNIIIQWCGTEAGFWGLFNNIPALLPPGHIAFLPYLFILTQLLIPMKVTMMNSFANRPNSETIIPTAPKAWRIVSIVWLFTLMVVSSGLFFWGLIFITVFCCLLFGMWFFEGS